MSYTPYRLVALTPVGPKGVWDQPEVTSLVLSSRRNIVSLVTSGKISRSRDKIRIIEVKE